ncbi:MAG: DUF924 family protein [Luteimonas sp.]
MIHKDEVPACEPTRDQPGAGWIDAVLDFWFGDCDEPDWFGKDAAFDAVIRGRFMPLYRQLQSQCDLVPQSPREALAAVVVLDQFPRNMFRNEPRAYATDIQALRIARAAIASGFDQDLPNRERLFLYLPLEHSEDLHDQEVACRLTAATGDVRWTRYAQAHQAIIERFGRFPHRNAVLGRTSTPEELAFLETPGSAF